MHGVCNFMKSQEKIKYLINIVDIKVFDKKEKTDFDTNNKIMQPGYLKDVLRKTKKEGRILNWREKKMRKNKIDADEKKET